MKFLSVCSGIEAASVALEPLGFEPIAFAENNKQASRNLSHHWPKVPNLGDMTAIDGGQWAEAAMVIGGTPCQAWSNAGRRQSLKDARANLAFSYVEICHAIQAARKREGRSDLVALWENVPGVLSTKDNAFGCFLSGLVGGDTAIRSPMECGRFPGVGMVSGPLARAAWRVFDAQYFGLPQRRERVFVVVCFGTRNDPAKILFEPAGLRRHPPSRRKPGENAPEGVARSPGSNRIPEVSHALNASSGGDSGKGAHERTFIAEEITGALSADSHPGSYSGQDAYQGKLVPELAWALQARDAKGTDSDTKDGHLIVEPIPILEAGARTGRAGFEGKDGLGVGEPGDPMFTLQSSKQHALLAFGAKGYGQDVMEDISPAVRAMNSVDANPNGGGQIAVAFKPGYFTRGKDGAPDEITPPLCADADKGDQDPVVFQSRIARNGRGQPEAICPALNGSDAGATSDMRPLVAFPGGEPEYRVRRLLPVECERLQGFPDGHTAVPDGNRPMADSARYRQLGNSMPVPVIQWIGRRIMAEVGDA